MFSVRCLVADAAVTSALPPRRVRRDSFTAGHYVDVGNT